MISTRQCRGTSAGVAPISEFAQPFTTLPGRDVDEIIANSRSSRIPEGRGHNRGRIDPYRRDPTRDAPVIGSFGYTSHVRTQRLHPG